MLISNSPDISELLVSAVFDLTPTSPVVKMVQHSSGLRLNLMTYFFEVYSPNGEVIHKATTTPDVTGTFTEFEIPEDLPIFQGSVEWSGNPYKVVVKAKDSTGKIFELPPIQIVLVTPAGNKRVGKNFGEGKIDVRVDCATGQAFIKDLTPYSYQGKKGRLLPDSSIIIAEPADENGDFAEPKVYEGFSQILHPLRVSGKGYRALLQTRIEYDMGGGGLIRLRYIKTQAFDVNCNYDLCPLLYEYAKYMENADRACDPADDRKFILINAKLTQAVIAKMQPTCGYDLGKLIDEIKELGGWHHCDCSCGGYIGINGNSQTGAGSELNIDFERGGDIEAESVIDGNNILLKIKDYTYVIQVSNAPANRAFTFTPSTNNRTKTFTLNTDLTKLTEDILTTVGGAENLINSFNALVKNNFRLTVDAKGFVDSNPVCDYNIGIAGLPTSPANAILKTITINGVVYNVNAQVGSSNVNVLKGALDALGKGTFFVANVSGTLSITSLGNPNNITEAVIYGTGGTLTDKFMTITKANCVGSASYDPSVVVQAMLNYLNKLKTSQILLGSDIVFCKRKPDGSLENVAFKATDNLSMFLTAMNDNFCQAIAVGSGQTVSAQDVVNWFANTTNTLANGDFVLGVRNGVAGRWSAADLTLRMINYINTTNSTAELADWCKAVARCNVASTCNPVTYLEAQLRAINVNDFAIVGSDLVFAGAKTGLATPFAINVLFTQVSGGGVTGAQYTYAVPINSTKITNVFANAPNLFAGMRWSITSVSYAPAGNDYLYLVAAILNNGAASYKVAYRKSSSTAPFTYTTVPADAGQYTVAMFAAPVGDYTISVMAVCGPNSDSVPIATDSGKCPLPVAFNIVRLGNNFRVNFQVATGITKVNLKIEYPNGGIYNQIHNATAGSDNVVLVPVPDGMIGDFKGFLRSVCNETAGWFSPFTNPVNTNVATTSVSSCPQIANASVTNITQTTAQVLISPASNMTGAQFLTLLLTRAGGTLQTISVPASTTSYTLTDLIPNAGYSLDIRTECANAQSSIPFAVGTFTTLNTPGPITQRTAYFGVADSINAAQALTTLQIEAALSQQYAVGGEVTGNWTTFNSPKILWIAIPAAEATMVSWFQSNFNQGDIGAFPNTFNGPYAIGSTYKLYYTNYATQQNGGPILFRSYAP